MSINTSGPILNDTGMIGWARFSFGEMQFTHTKDRDIGTVDEFFAELATYLDFLIEPEGQTPRP